MIHKIYVAVAKNPRDFLKSHRYSEIEICERVFIFD